MTSSNTRSDVNDQIVAAFLREMESTTDQATVLRRYQESHPDLAIEFANLASLAGRLDQARPETDEPLPKQIGEYQIVRRIGVSMDEVYEAWQPSLNRRVAIKTIRRGRISPEARERFMRQQLVLANLHHTHIVPIHGAGEVGLLQYFVMPYIEGAALHHVIGAAREFETANPAAGTPSLKELAERAAKKEPPDTASAAAAATISADSVRAESSPNRTIEQRNHWTLSMEYFRSVAQVMADAGEALQFAHDAGVLHRDLKPSNLMVDKNGHCWIIDFGLAGYIKRGSKPQRYEPSGNSTSNTGDGTFVEKQEALDLVLASPPISTSGIMGTPQYMSPEQWAGQTDPRTDVWGLGATLYELLTLKRAYDGETPSEIRRAVHETDVRSPRSIASNLPRDLEAISMKAMNKDASKRYTSPLEFAEDLRHWLRMEPTVALPPHVVRRTYLWSRRNPGWAAAMIFFIVAAVASIWALLGAAVMAEDAERRKAEKEANEKTAAQAEAKNAKEVHLKNLAIQEIQRLRLSPRRQGWNDKTFEHVKIAAKNDKSLNLRNQAVASLQGLDAIKEKRFDSPASSVAISRDGKRLLMGGFRDKPARLWDGTLNAAKNSALPGDGPVAFSADGTPLQLVSRQSQDKKLHLVLWDVAKQVKLHEFEFPLAASPVNSWLSREGMIVAASAKLPDGKAVTHIWDARSGKEIRSHDDFTVALAFAPDASLIARSFEDGAVSITELSNGKVLFSQHRDRAMVTALAFGPDLHRRNRSVRPGHGWLLAAGDETGTLTIWDVENSAILSFCRGSHHHIRAIAFSPDGATLASVGRADVRLWDIASGASVLAIYENNWLTDVAFSPDGRRVAVSSVPVFDYRGQVTVWSLANGRGIKSLHGLSAEVEQVIYSPNDRLIAALSHDCRVGVWDAATDRLLHVFDAPRTTWVDNAAIAFTPDNENLVYAGAGNAKMWSIADGKEVSVWKLPNGLHNKVAFHREKGLILFQVERTDEKKALGRVYRLPKQKPREVLQTISEFDLNIDFPRLSNDGSLLVVVGYYSNGKSAKRRIKAFNPVTGESAYVSDPEDLPSKFGLEINLDRDGKTLGVKRGGAEFLLAMPKGTYLDRLDDRRAAAHFDWSVKMPFQIARGWKGYERYPLAVIPSKGMEPVVILGMDTEPTGIRMSFNSDGNAYAWGCANGTVSIADFPEIHRQLTKLGLEW